MEIHLLCALFDHLVITNGSHLPSEEEDLLCGFFGRLRISGDVKLLPTCYSISPVGHQEDDILDSGHGLHRLGFFILIKALGMPWCSLQAQFWFQEYPAKFMFLVRQLKRDFFLFISYSVVRRKNIWLAFGFFEDDQYWSNTMFCILWRYRKFGLPPASASVSSSPIFSLLHGGGRISIHIVFNSVSRKFLFSFLISCHVMLCLDLDTNVGLSGYLVSVLSSSYIVVCGVSIRIIKVIVCCHFIFYILFSWYPMLRYSTLGKDCWFYTLWRYRTFGKDQYRLLRRYINSSPSRLQQQAQPPSPVSWFKHGTAPVLWMVWFVCDPSSPMVSNSFRSLLYPSNPWLFLWKVGEAGGITTFASLHGKRSLQQQLSPGRQLMLRTRGTCHWNIANQCVNGLCSQPRKFHMECPTTMFCVLWVNACSRIRDKMFWLAEILTCVLNYVRHSFI